MTTSVIGKDAIVRGKLRGEGDVEIAGRLEGDVRVDGEVTVAPGGLVIAMINAQRIVVRGSVRGDVTATEFLELGPEARIIGNLRAPSIAIEEGALIRGQVETGTKSRAPQKAVATRNIAATETRTRPAPQEREMPKPAKVQAPPPKAPASLPKLAPKVPLVVKAIPPKKPTKAPPMVVPVLKKGTKAKRK